MDLLTDVRKAFSIEGEKNKIGIGDGKSIENHFLFGIVLTVSIYFFFINVSVFMDDVFIYLRVAKNIANGSGPVLNPGDSHFPVTSPLWTYILAFFYKIFGLTDIVELSKIVSTLLLAGASTFAFLSMRRYIGTWAVLAPLPILFNYITVTTIGGEIPLVYLSLFGVLWAYYSKKDFLLTGLFAAAAYLARAELILILPIIALHYLANWKKEKKTLRIMASDWGKLSIVFLSIISIWHIYYAIQFHSIFPNTLKTKMIQGKSGQWQYYYRMGRPLTLEILGGMKFLIIPLLFGLIYFREISLSLLLFTTFHFYAYKLLIVPYYHWYFYDFFILIPMFTLFGMIAFFVFLRKWIGPKFPGDIKMLSIFLILFLSGLLINITTKINSLPTYKNDPRFISYKKIADSIRPKINKGDIILAPEIGIIGYYLEDAVIRDLCGIASPDVTVKNINNLDYFVKVYSPRFIFFPYFMNQKSPNRFFTDNQGKNIVYSLEYPQIELTNPIDCIFSRGSFEKPPLDPAKLFVK